jgi:dTDP-L-rhamnose 4-epimerase
VVDATILGLENQQLKNEVLNVGSGINTSVLEVAQKLKKAYSSSVDIKINGNFRLGDIRHNYADLAKISSIGFRPKVFFEEGVVKFTSWVKQQKVQQDTYEMSIQELKEKGLYK